MICAHSALTCPFCRCRLSTWLRYNPGYSKLIVKRQHPEVKTRKKAMKKRKTNSKKENNVKQQSKRRYQTSKTKATRKHEV